MTISQWISNQVVYISKHPSYGLLFAFLVALIESVAIIGSIIPGSVTMTAIGTLIGASILPLSTTLLMTTVGAWIGDTLSYWGGRYGKTYIWQCKWIKKRKNWLISGEEFFKKHGRKSIIIGRFIGPMRSTMPMMAGMMDMSANQFYIAALMCAFLWSIVYMTPGIMLGAFSHEFSRQTFEHMAIEGLYLSCIVVSFYLLWPKWGQWYKNKMHCLVAYILLKYHLYVKNKHVHSIDQNISSLSSVFICIVSTLGYLLLVLCIGILSANHVAVIHFNDHIYHLLQSLHLRPYSTMLIWISEMGKYKIGAIWTIVLGSYAFIYRRPWTAILPFAIAYTAMVAIAYIGKASFAIPRPIIGAILKQSSAFPSGHAATAVLLYGTLASMINTPSWYVKNVLKWMCYMLIAMIVISRIYLGFHWVTDVIAGSMIGLLSHQIYVCLSQFFPKITITQDKPSYYLIITLLTVSMIWAYANANPSYYHETRQKTLIEHSVPMFRSSRMGNNHEPFNIRWDDSLNHIDKALKRLKWTIWPVNHNLGWRFTHFLDKTQKPLYPLITKLYRDQPAIRLASINHDHRMHVLRLWPLDVDGHAMGYIGVLSTMHHRDIWQHKLKDSNAMIYTLEALQHISKHAHVIHVDRPLEQQQFKWDGKIMVIPAIHRLLL